jgi:hypothetical protein
MKNRFTSLEDRMRRSLAWLLLLALLVPANAMAKSTLVVVFEIEDQSRTLKRRDIPPLTDYLAAKMAEYRAFKVIPMDRLRSVLTEQRKRKCTDWGCQSSVASTFNASKILATKVFKLGTRCVVVANLYDLETSVAERSANIKGECNQDALVASIDQVAPKLAGRRAKKRTVKPKAAVAAVPAAPPVYKPATPSPKQPAVAAAPAPATGATPAAAPAAATPAPEPKPTPAVQAPPRKDKRSFRKFPLWPTLVGAGVGVVGLAIGIPMLALDGQGTDCEGEPLPDKSNCETLYDTAVPGGIFTAIGVGALVASGVLLYLHLKSPRKEYKVQALTVSPTQHGGMMVNAAGRF